MTGLLLRIVVSPLLLFFLGVTVRSSRKISRTFQIGLHARRVANLRATQNARAAGGTATRNQANFARREAGSSETSLLADFRSSWVRVMTMPAFVRPGRSGGFR